MEKTKDVYPSKLSKDLKVSPATGSRKLQELLDLSLVSAEWKLDNQDGMERPIKIYRLTHTAMCYSLNIGTPKGIESLTEALKQPKKATEMNIKYVGDHFAEHIVYKSMGFGDVDKTRLRVYCTVNEEPLVYSGKTAELLSELNRRKTTKLSDLAKKKEFSNAPDLRKNLTQLLIQGVINVNGK
ncbi:MAG: hypothetical protein GOV15_02900 [Candidatus Diapherotrites archaeon]|nr:hypothetical protein [Candidatus Diapherotrites archaeon]